MSKMYQFAIQWQKQIFATIMGTVIKLHIKWLVILHHDAQNK